MNNTVKTILEKMKKVERGYLDQPEKGDDEQRFIDKHIDNVATYDADGKEEHDDIHGAAQKADRKPHKGYDPGEDEEVYESTMDTDLLSIMEDMSLEESTDFFFNVLEETIDEFFNEEATDEEKEILEDVFSSEENYAEFLEMIFEAEKCEDDEMDDEEDEDEEEDDEDEVIDTEPKMKKTGKNAVTEETTRTSDFSMVKVKLPDGKVVYRRQRKET